MVTWSLKVKIYGRYKLNVLQSHIDREILGIKKASGASRSGSPSVLPALSEKKIIISEEIPILVEHHKSQSDVLSEK